MRWWFGGSGGERMSVVLGSGKRQCILTVFHFIIIGGIMWRKSPSSMNHYSISLQAGPWLVFLGWCLVDVLSFRWWALLFNGFFFFFFLFLADGKIFCYKEEKQTKKKGIRPFILRCLYSQSFMSDTFFKY